MTTKQSLTSIGQLVPELPVTDVEPGRTRL
jgi:hypothetical protein